MLWERFGCSVFVMGFLEVENFPFITVVFGAQRHSAHFEREISQKSCIIILTKIRRNVDGEEEIKTSCR